MANPRAEFIGGLEANGTDEVREIRETDFSENFGASMMGFMSEDLSISRWLNEGVIRDRNNQLKKMYTDNIFTEEEWGMFRKREGIYQVNTDWDAAVQYAKDKGLEGSETLQFTEELQKNIRSDLAFRRKYVASVNERSTGMGTLGMVTGIVAGAATDPINVLGVVATPVRAYQAAGIVGKLGIAAGTNMALETAIQPIVYNYKQDIDSPYSGKDAMIAIAAAGGVGVTFDGLGQVFRSGVKKLKAAKANGQMKDLDEADGAIDALEDQIIELDQAPDKSVDPAQYVQDIDDAVRAKTAIEKAHAEETEPFLDVDDSELEAAFKANTEVEEYKEIMEVYKAELDEQKTATTLWQGAIRCLL